LIIKHIDILASLEYARTLAEEQLSPLEALEG